MTDLDVQAAADEAKQLWNEQFVVAAKRSTERNRNTALRDQFAMAALPVANLILGPNTHVSQIANTAYAVADAMMKEREE